MPAVSPPPLQVPLANKEGKLPDIWQRWMLDTSRALDAGTAPADAPFLVATSNADLSAEVNLGALSSGFLKIAVAAGIATVSSAAAIAQADVTGLVAALAALAPVDGGWTPVDGSGASLSFTITHPALYTKIGRAVFVSFAIVYPATASGALAVVGGLPYTSGGGGGQQYALLTVYSDYGAGMLNFVAAAGTTISFFSLAPAGLTNANLSGKTIRCTGWYFT
jgi:hypothetical protein